MQATILGGAKRKNTSKVFFENLWLLVDGFLLCESLKFLIGDLEIPTQAHKIIIGPLKQSHKGKMLYLSIVHMEWNLQ